MRGVMRRAWLVLGMAGFAGPAMAQNIGTDLVVSLTFDRTSIGIGETAVATMTASWNGLPWSYLGAVAVDLIASDGLVLVSEVAAVAWNNPALGLNGQGVAVGPDVIGLFASQFSLIPPYTTDNPILITTFVVTGIGAGELSYRSRTGQGVPFSYYVEDGSLTGPVVYWGDDVFVSQTLVVTPGPGGVGVLGVAGLVGVRRRRG